MIDKPEIIQTESRLTAVIRFTIPRDQIGVVMGPAMGEVMAAVKAAGLSPAGPMFSRHFKMEPDIFDFEVGVPVNATITTTGRVVPSDLPAAKVARTNYRGPYEGLGEGWGEFMDWIEAEELVPEQGLWEYYLTGPESGDDPATWTTELNRPLKS